MAHCPRFSLTEVPWFFRKWYVLTFSSVGIFILTATERWLKCDARWIFGREWYYRLILLSLTDHLWFYQALAQSVIFSAYLLYGAFIYVSHSPCPFPVCGGLYLFPQAFQGQFTLPFAYQGVSKYSWQTVGEATRLANYFQIVTDIIVGNALALVTGIIAAGLYGNIGISKCFFLKILFSQNITYKLIRDRVYQHYRRLV